MCVSGYVSEGHSCIHQGGEVVQKIHGDKSILAEGREVRRWDTCMLQIEIWTYRETERWTYRQDSQTEREIDQINGHKDSQLDRKRDRPD